MSYGSVNKSSTASAPRTSTVGHCVLCGENGAVVLFEAQDRLHGTPGTFTYRQCDICRSVYQDPRVISEDLPLCYPALYYTHHTQNEANAKNDYPLDSAAMRKSNNLRGLRDSLRASIRAEVQGEIFKGWFRIIGRIGARSKSLRERAFYGLVSDEFLPRTPQYSDALDIGCGDGRHLKELKKVWKAEGVEWDPQAAENTEKSTGCQVWVGDFRNIPLPKEKYGLILLHHVIEHLDDPGASLHRVWELLAPGGRVILVYPNHESLGAKLFGDSWFPWEVPRHLVFPAAHTLIEIANNVGYKILKYKTSAYAAAYFSSLSRSYRAGLSVDEYNPDISLLDRCFGLIEKSLLILGLKAGEETILVLTKPKR